MTTHCTRAPRLASLAKADTPIAREIPIAGCAPAPLRPHSDGRGCLVELFREEWPGAFKTVQWNACVTYAGVVRGVHVHVDYDEFYTLPVGRVFLALRDIRRASPTFGTTVSFEWSAADGFAVPVPAGVAHAALALEDSVLAFGLSGYWNAKLDVVGCQWQDLDPSLRWPMGVSGISARDSQSGTFASMVAKYEELSASLSKSATTPST